MTSTASQIKWPARVYFYPVKEHLSLLSELCSVIASVDTFIVL